jgi:alpha-tubulin suppressor-like RCC1 family protein
MKKAIVLAGIAFALSGCGMFARTTAPSPIPPATSAPTATATNTPLPTKTHIPTFTASPTPEVSNIAVDIAAGWNHTCVVTLAGTVECWGNNEHGQLGDGSTENNSVPVQVVGLNHVKKIAAGWAHTCALMESGEVKCWGYNKNGELGNGKTGDSAWLVDVKGLSWDVIAIEAGDDHTCAVTARGKVQCWGYNEYGQLGNQTQESSSIPQQVRDLSGDVVGLAAGWGHTCALTSGGQVWCWGNNEMGQLGTGQKDKVSLEPVMVKALGDTVRQITGAGGQTCARLLDDVVKCWGNNKYGQLGDRTAQTKSLPVALTGQNPRLRIVASGWNHTCGVTLQGDAECWGWNLYGQLGDESQSSQSAPVAVTQWKLDIHEFALGYAHTCAITGIGEVYCCGSNEFGQRGDGEFPNSALRDGVLGFHKFGPTPTPEVFRQAEKNSTGDWGTIPSSTHIYQVVNKSMTWEEANSYCLMLNAHLATIGSIDEQTGILDLVNRAGTTQSYWLGAQRDGGDPSKWMWIMGGGSFSYTYTHWADGEPSSPDEKYLEMVGFNNPGIHQPGYWNDVRNDANTNPAVSYGLICEWDR